FVAHVREKFAFRTVGRLGSFLRALQTFREPAGKQADENASQNGSRERLDGCTASFSLIFHSRAKLIPLLLADVPANFFHASHIAFHSANSCPSCRQVVCANCLDHVHLRRCNSRQKSCEFEDFWIARQRGLQLLNIFIQGRQGTDSQDCCRTPLFGVRSAD